MKRSTDRIQTTHVGSIPRPDSLVDFMIAEDKGEAFDEAAFETALTEAVNDVVAHQKDPRDRHRQRRRIFQAWLRGLRP
jgi:5-methyltetrahydropteroyltriglutamate--homocysteine methyltransferase